MFDSRQELILSLSLSPSPTHVFVRVFHCVDMPPRRVKVRRQTARRADTSVAGKKRDAKFVTGQEVEEEDNRAKRQRTPTPVEMDDLTDLKLSQTTVPGSPLPLPPLPPPQTMVPKSVAITMTPQKPPRPPAAAAAAASAEVYESLECDEKELPL